MLWRAHLCIGEKRIDRQRRRLFEMVKTMKAVLHTDRMYGLTGKALKFIVTCANEHFIAEETYMASIGFPQESAHKAQHDRLTRDIQAILLKIKQGKHVSPSQLLEFLTDWLLNHTLAEDLKIRQFLDQTEREQKTARLQRYAGERSAAWDGLKQIAALHSKETITREAYLIKKRAILDALIPSENVLSMNEIEARITLLETFLNESLIEAHEERSYKQRAFGLVNLDEELGKRPKIKAKVSYLKSLLTRDLITEDQFNTYCDDLRGKTPTGKPPDRDIVQLL